MTAGNPRRFELIVHAGFHKTGSSSIQETFCRLEIPHIEYAIWGNANHSGSFRFAFHEPKSEIYGVGQAPEAIAEAEAIGERRRAKLRTALESCTKPALMISAEDISSTNSNLALRAFHEFVSPHVAEIFVHAYVRPPGDLVASTFQQRVKAGVNADLYSGTRLRQRIEMLDRVFGSEKVNCYSFDRSALLGGDVVKDLAYRLGVQIKDEEIVRTNEAVAAEVVGVLFCHLKHGRHRLGYFGAPGVQQALVRELEALGTMRFRFSNALIRENLANSSDDFAWVERRLGRVFIHTEHEGGVTTEQDVLALGIAQHDRLAELVKEIARREGVTPDLPRGAPEAQSIAVMVDTIKDMLRVGMERERAGPGSAKGVRGRTIFDLASRVPLLKRLGAKTMRLTGN